MFLSVLQKPRIVVSLAAILCALLIAAPSFVWADNTQEPGTTILELSQNIDNAKLAMDNAEATATQSKSVADADAEVFELAQQVDKCAKEKLALVQQALSTAESQLSAATQQQADARAAKATAESNLSEAQTEKAAAQTAVTSAQTDKNAADSAVAAAKADVADKQQALEAAQAQINKGSFGFFEEKESTRALNALNRTGYNNITDYGDLYTSYTEQANPNDATSLDSMKNSID